MNRNLLGALLLVISFLGATDIVMAKTVYGPKPKPKQTSLSLPAAYKAAQDSPAPVPVSFLPEKSDYKRPQYIITKGTQNKGRNGVEVYQGQTYVCADKDCKMMRVQN